MVVEETHDYYTGRDVRYEGRDLRQREVHGRLEGRKKDFLMNLDLHGKQLEGNEE